MYNLRPKNVSAIFLYVEVHTGIKCYDFGMLKCNISFELSYFLIFFTFYILFYDCYKEGAHHGHNKWIKEKDNT